MPVLPATIYYVILTCHLTSHLFSAIAISADSAYSNRYKGIISAGQSLEMFVTFLELARQVPSQYTKISSLLLYPSPL